MENNFKTLLTSDDNEIVTESFTIKDNILKLNDITLHLSNIATLYAGKKKFKVPFIAIFIFLISFFILFEFLIVGLIGCGLSGVYIWLIYQSYSSNKQYLNFQMNSGKYYRIYFSDKAFLEKAKSIVEKAFNNKNMEYTVNIKEQKIIHGNDYKVSGNNNVFDATIQENSNVNSHNADSFNIYDEDNSVKIRNIKDTSINGAIFGNNNNLNASTHSNSNFNWKEIVSDLEQVISSIKIDSDVKKASIEALTASKKEDMVLFESTIKKYAKEFLSDLFQNTARGLLLQVVSKILGV
ncbi:hypothetical protein [Bacillus toyonensis]|uniref:hypothetical protein n=1 Tax=Bacillus toyonensis TaxID=155322 RepID=UPI001C0B5B57|nr:hypothetical protein [Bacillus toyonensis]MBU4642333.1 hypothetical protein [Bacillus toyonensis]